MSAIDLDEAKRQLQDHQRHLWEPFDQKELPDQLFHYTTATGLHGILREKKIWASDVCCLNDASEWRYSINAVRKVAKKRNDDLSQQVNHVLDRHQQAMLGVGREWFVYVACFCEDGDLLSQWRGYGETNDGFAVGVPRTALQERAVNESVLVKMLYEPSQQEKIVISTLEQGSTLLEAYEAKEDKAKFFCKFGLVLTGCMLRFKHPSFKEEREWRLLVTMPLEHNEERVKYRSWAGNIVPYVDVPFDPCQISRVIQAPGARDFNQQTIPRLLRTLGCADKQVHKSNIPLGQCAGEYRLDWRTREGATPHDVGHGSSGKSSQGPIMDRAELEEPMTPEVQAWGKRRRMNKLWTLGRGKKAKEFEYEGSVRTQVTLRQTGSPRIDAAFFKAALKHFAGREVKGGFTEDNPAKGGFGE